MSWNRNRDKDVLTDDRRSPLAGLPTRSELRSELDSSRAPIPSEIETPDVRHVDDPDDHGTVLAIFSGAKRSGGWEPPARLTVVALFGGCELDFCEAELLEGETVIEVWALFGGVQIRVPPDIDVITEGIGIFGNFDQKDQRGEDPQPPRLRIRGLSLFAGVDLKGPRRLRRLRRSREEG